MLDPEAFVARLRRELPEANPGTARNSYLRYKPGTSCLASYRIEAGGEEIRVHAKAHGPDAADKLDKARKKPGVPGPLGIGRLVLEDLAIVVSFFPNDRDLKALPHLDDPEERKGLLRNLLPGRPDLWESGIETLRYKPERRYVARLVDGGEARAILKVYTESNYRAARTNAEAFTEAFKTQGPFRLAPLLGHSDRHRMLIFEWLPGRPLDEAILDPEVKLHKVAIVGAGLAELHAQEPEGLKILGREEEIDILAEVAEGVGAVSPHLAGRAREIARGLADQLVGAPSMGRPIHGDFDAGQVLLGEDAITLLDLDRTVRGDPAEDLGLFIAHLERAVLDGGMSAGRAESLKEALLDGYRISTHRPTPERIEVYTAAGLLRLCPEPFRYRARDWPRQTERVLDRAAEILNTGFSNDNPVLWPADGLRAGKS